MRKLNPDVQGVIMTIFDLKKKWDSMPIYDCGFSLVDPSHPNEIYIGYRTPEEKEVRFYGVDDYHDIPSSKSLEARMIKKTDGSFVLSIYLKRKENTDEFISLLWDIIESCRTCDNYCQCVYEKYCMWYRLLELSKGSVLSFERQKGLLAELLYLEELIKKNDEEIVNTWLGPEGADQDFVFSASWTEVKAVSAAAEVVKISSLQQLDADGAGILRLYYLETTSDENSNGITLPKKIEEIKDLFTNNLCKDKFLIKLREYGYRKDDENKYLENKFSLLKISDFSITEGFPKLTNANVPVGIGNVKYTISINSISDYQIS